MIDIGAIADYLAPEFPVIATVRLFHDGGSKIVLEDGTCIDVFDDGVIIPRGAIPKPLMDALNELPYWSEGILKVMPDLSRRTHSLCTLQQAS